MTLDAPMPERKDDLWVPGTSLAGLVSSVSPAISAALLSYVAAARSHNMEGMKAQTKILRHIVTRIDAYSRHALREWQTKGTQPDESNHGSHAGERPQGGGIEQVGTVIRSGEFRSRVAEKEPGRLPPFSGLGNAESSVIPPAKRNKPQTPPRK